MRNRQGQHVAFTALVMVSAVLLLGWSRTAQTKSSEEKAKAAARANNLGVAYMSQQRFEKALEFFTRARELDPGLHTARLNEGIALSNLQKTEQARSVLEDIARAEPKNARAWYNLGLLFKNSGDAERALAAFSHAVELAPQDVDAHYFVGATLAELKRDADAVKEFENALSLDPYHASAEFGLSRSLMRLGRTDEAREHLQRFQHLTITKLGTPVTLNYGDQGPLSYAVDVKEGVSPVPPPIPVTFSPDASGFGAPAPSPSAAAGACWLDVDGDGRPDLLLTSAGTNGNMMLLRNAPGGKFSDISSTSSLPARAAQACAAADYDNDGRTDIALGLADGLLLLRNEGNGKLLDVTRLSGLPENIGRVTGLLWVDYDHDGDADLMALTPSSVQKIRVFRNNGNGKFTEVTEELGFNSLSGNFESATLTDYNNDRAIDLVFAGDTTTLFRNPREGKWQVENIFPKALGSVGIAVLDFNKDGYMDLAFTHSEAPGISLWRNLDIKRFEPVSLPIRLRRAWGIAAFDYDNDGWIDLAVAGEDESGKPVVRLLRNEGERGFRDVSEEVGLTKIAWRSPRTITSVDYDLDGAADLLVSQADAPPILLRNQGGNQNHSLRLVLQGLNDNKSAIGTKVEVFAGDVYQKFEVSGSGYLGQSSLPLLVGLGSNPSTDVVRMLWPTGVLQDEVEITTKAARFTEIDRRGSSCPVLFAWDGGKFRFVSDMIGAGVVGHWIAPGQRNLADPTEYLKLDFEPKPQQGRLKLRFMEPMEETVYLDSVRLLAVDHPESAEVVPNEYFASNPPFPEFKIVASRYAIPVAAARDDSGRDVTGLLRNDDRQYVSGFEILPYKGFTKMHSLELDLGEPYKGGTLRLLMTGYIEYFTATSMFAAHQAGLEPVAPFVETLTADGKWVRVIDDLGFPAGLHRATVADLTGRLPVGTSRIRITTNLQIYWDQILVDRTSAPIAVNSYEIPLTAANLEFRGYPEAIEGKSPGDLTYIYEKVSKTGPYTHQAGEYTRFGDVGELLRKADDRFVVFGSGEEVALEFNVAGLPALPRGWKRDYFFFADGFEKDMDFYAADFLSVEPLPAHVFGSYPDQVAFPTDAEHLRYRLEYNTRTASD